MKNLIIMSGNIVSGAELVLLDYLERTDCNFILLTTSKIKETGLFNLKNVKIICMDELEMLGAGSGNLLLKIRKIRNIFIGTKKILKIIKEEKIKNILTNNTGDILYLTLISARQQLRIYSYIHDIIKKHSLISKIIKLNIKKIQKIITVSDSAKEALIKSGVSSDKVTRIYNGLELNPFFKKNKFTKKLVFIGSIIDRKNPFEFLEFVNKISKRGYCGEIIYKYSEEKLLKNLIEKIKKDNIPITLRYGLSREEIEEKLKDVDFLFICSKNDPLPTVVLEAINNSVVTIGKEIDGIPEMIIDNYNGFIYGDFSELDDIVEKISNLSLEEYNKMSLFGNNLLEEKFNIDFKVKELDSYFKTGEI